MSNDLGYKIIKVQPAPRDLIEAAKAEISMENLRKFQQSTSSLGFERLGWGESNSRLLHDGFDFGDDEFLKTLLQKPYSDAKILVNDVVVWMHNPQVKRLKAGRGRAFIYRAVEEELGPENGFFRIVEGSHRMKAEDIINAPAIDIRLEPGDIIIVDGDLVIEYPQPGGGVGLLKCVSKSL